MNGIVGLLYHDVFPDAHEPYGSLGRSATSYHVCQSTFARQLDLIVQSQLPVLSLADLAERLEWDDPPPGVFICFDDGWRGSFEIAGAELATRHLPATIFVTSDFVGRPLFADAALVRAAAGNAVTIGSHGRSHRMLSSLPRADVRSELRESKDRLEQWSGSPVTSLSIPGGARDSMVISEAMAAGFSLVFDSAPRLNPSSLGPRGVGRVSVRRSTGDPTFGRWLRGDLRREFVVDTVLGLPKALLGIRNYVRLRRFVLGERGRQGETLFEP